MSRDLINKLTNYYRGDWGFPTQSPRDLAISELSGKSAEWIVDRLKHIHIDDYNLGDWHSIRSGLKEALENALRRDDEFMWFIRTVGIEHEEMSPGFYRVHVTESREPSVILEISKRMQEKKSLKCMYWMLTECHGEPARQFMLELVFPKPAGKYKQVPDYYEFQQEIREHLALSGQARALDLIASKPVATLTHSEISALARHRPSRGILNEIKHNYKAHHWRAGYSNADDRNRRAAKARLLDLCFSSLTKDRADDETFRFVLGCLQDSDLDECASRAVQGSKNTNPEFLPFLLERVLGNPDKDEIKYHMKRVWERVSREQQPQEPLDPLVSNRTIAAKLREGLMSENAGSDLMTPYSALSDTCRELHRWWCGHDDQVPTALRKALETWIQQDGERAERDAPHKKQADDLIARRGRCLLLCGLAPILTILVSMIWGTGWAAGKESSLSTAGLALGAALLFIVIEMIFSDRLSVYRDKEPLQQLQGCAVTVVVFISCFLWITGWLIARHWHILGTIVAHIFPFLVVSIDWMFSSLKPKEEIGPSLFR